MTPSCTAPRASRDAGLRWTGFAAYSLLVAFLCLTPTPPVGDMPLIFPHADKVVHALLFGIQTILLIRALYGATSPRHAALAAAVCSLYGIVLEFLQTWAPAAGRTFDWVDMAANAAGAAIAAGLTYRIASGSLFHQVCAEP